MLAKPGDDELQYKGKGDETLQHRDRKIELQREGSSNS
jgi:hypothetical protein